MGLLKVSTVSKNPSVCPSIALFIVKLERPRTRNYVKVVREPTTCVRLHKLRDGIKGIVYTYTFKRSV